MKNREVFLKDPGTLNLLNNGVATVADMEDAEQRRTLRFELETFVCEGEYERGLTKEAQQQDILKRLALNVIPGIQTGTEAELLASLDSRPLQHWATLRDALPQRFQNALVEAARLLEPRAVRIDLPHGTFKSIEDFDAWADQVRQDVLRKLEEGPVII